MTNGQQVIVRTYSAGVHYGTLASREGKEVVLTSARRIWYWEGASSLSQIAAEGCSSESKISVPVSEIVLTEAIEVIACSESAVARLAEIKPWRE